MPIPRATVENFTRAVGTTNCHMDFRAFCAATGFVGWYAEGKWQEFCGLARSLGRFDNDTLAKILNHPLPSDSPAP